MNQNGYQTVFMCNSRRNRIIHLKPNLQIEYLKINFKSYKTFSFWGSCRELLRIFLGKFQSNHPYRSSFLARNLLKKSQIRIFPRIPEKEFVNSCFYFNFLHWTAIAALIEIFIILQRLLTGDLSAQAD